MLILHVEPRRAGKVARRRLKACGCQVEYVDCSDQAELLTALAARPYEAIFLRLGLALDARALDAGGELRFAVTPTTGLDHIDLAAAEERGVEVLSLRGETEFLATVRTTAEHTWALLLASMRHLVPALEDVRRGSWRREPFLADELDGNTLGILGLGRLGRIVAGYGVAFGMEVLAHDIDPDAFRSAPAAVAARSRDELLAQADVVSVHLPLDETTAGYLDADALSRMRRGAVLINTARGELVDEEALLEALESGRLAAAGLDVLAGDSRWSEQGPGAEHPLVRYAREHENLLLTPHMAGYGRNAIARTRLFMIEKFLRAAGKSRGGAEPGES
ncbi:MAG: NAD(P)-dependent oxidoreductase [Acidobacteriota bacterium]|nr:NAD(P)-dependent oxidoreductase [Acidobacteriota bacterium]